MKRLRSCRMTVLLLDFDGTLAPIRRTPSLAALPSATKRLLQHLAKSPTVTVGLVTGRARSDIIRKVRMSGLILISNHGFQISSGTLNWVHPAARRAAPLLRELSRILKRALRSVRNVLIENKTFTLSVHYRNVRKTDVRTVKSVVGHIVRQYKNNLKLTTGKKVLEIRSGAPWSKGHAVRRFLNSIGHAGSRCVVYVGDDTTDEDVFRLLPSSAVRIRVGKDQTSSAAYWVRTPSDVRKFLGIVDSINDRNQV